MSISAHVGQALPEFRRVVEVADMKTMAALLADPNPIHWDPRSTVALGLGDRPVNQGPYNMGYLETMLARWAGGRDRIIDFEVRFLGNVLAGDTVRASGEVTDLREQEELGSVAQCALRLTVLADARTAERTALVGSAVVALERGLGAPR